MATGNELNTQMLLEILIPTYNRNEQLLKNLLLLRSAILSLGVNDKIGISIADNSSEKSPATMINEEIGCSGIRYKVKVHESNLGIEGNSLYLLRESDAKYVMFLGDDDYISENYLREVIVKISEKYTCIIPSFLLNTVDEKVVGSRGVGVSKSFKKGICSTTKLALLGHQLSGIVFLREGTLEAYLNQNKSGNIYPFISFVGINTMRGDSYLLAEYPVLVTVGELKYWNYGTDALFGEKIKNVRVIAKKQIHVFLLEKTFFIKNIYSILAVYPFFRERMVAFWSACTNKNLSVAFKFCIPYFIFILSLKKITNMIFVDYEPLK